MSTLTKANQLVSIAANLFSLSTIDSLNEHLKTGYHKEKERVEKVIAAINQGKIRVSKELDEHYDYDYSPFSAAETKKIKARVASEGVHTVVSEYWTGREWESMIGIEDNSIGGFIGSDFNGSGYELQLLEAALEAYNKQPLDETGFVIDPYRLKAIQESQSS